MKNNLDLLSINTIKMLGIDAINKANSGHPGIVLGAAPMTHLLYTKHLNLYPRKFDWINRDRFVLSAGHGSAMLYAINHLSGFKLSVDDLKNFRKYPGITPGHPEHSLKEGIETTSGPLGQGLANAVGMAIAEAHLAARFNKENYNLIDHYTFVVAGDGDLQEGVALESISLAGHLGLNKLIVLFDSNDIQLDGETNLAVSEDVKTKFTSQGWQYIKVDDGNDLSLLNRAINRAKRELNKPTLIEVKTIIGEDTNLAGTNKVHGAPIGFDEANKLREKLNYNYKEFEVSDDVYKFYRTKVYNRGRRNYNKWNKLFESYKKDYPNEASLLETFISGDLDLDFDELEVVKGSKNATRNTLGKVLDLASKKNLNFIGGSADLSSSTKVKGLDGNFTRENRLGRNINYGVREHAMGAITNGINLHGGLKAFSGGFFVFSDYMKPPMRLAGLMGLPSVFIFSHDSVLIGEDGPTHQPVEQLVALRTTPNLLVFRPADFNEVKGSLKYAFNSKDMPSAIITTRQNVLELDNSSEHKVASGAYVVKREKDKLDGIILACGSEVELAINSANLLAEKGYDIRVVSMPSQELFFMQTKKYQQEILPNNTKILAVEMGSTYSWYKLTKHVYGVDTFGISSPYQDVLEHFKFNPLSVANKMIEVLEK
ncbi:MAG: transketolase [Acholeplasmataceae bacterium]